MAVFDELKSIAKVLQEAGKIELYQKILDVQQQLLEMQNTIFELNSENKVLKETMETQETLVFERNAYWIVKDQTKDGPFCSRCWDDQKKTIRLLPLGNPAYYSCKNCENKSILVYPEKDRPSKIKSYI
jgi:hypothetical protein